MHGERCNECRPRQCHARADAKDGEGEGNNVGGEAGRDITNRENDKDQDDQASFREDAAEPRQEEKLDQDVDRTVGGEEVTQLLRTERMFIPGECIRQKNGELRTEHPV